MAEVSRRTLLQTGAWGVPVVAIAVAAPGSAASTIHPNLIPQISVSPQSVSVSDEFAPTFTINVVEVAGAPTDGSMITVAISRDARLMGPNFNRRVANNADWTFDYSNSDFYFLRSTTVIPANGLSTIQFTLFLYPSGTNGAVTTTATILSGSGGETPQADNSHSATLTYGP